MSKTDLKGKTTALSAVALSIVLIAVSVLALRVPSASAPPTEIIVDDASAAFVGTWYTSSYTSGYYGTGYHYCSAGTGLKTCTWVFTIPAADNWDVYARWTQSSNRASNAKYTVYHADGSNVVSVNQQTNGGVWYKLGTYRFSPIAYQIVLTDDANGIVIADAIRLVSAGVTPPPTASFYIAERQYSAWTVNLVGWQTIVSVTLPSLPAGYYLAEADAHAYQDNAVLAIGIGVDSTTADATTQRFYDSLGETDVRQGVHTQEVFYLAAGSHTFYFRAGNINSVGTAQLEYSHITVTYSSTGSIS